MGLHAKKVIARLEEEREQLADLKASGADLVLLERLYVDLGILLAALWEKYGASQSAALNRGV